MERIRLDGDGGGGGVTIGAAHETAAESNIVQQSWRFFFFFSDEKRIHEGHALLLFPNENKLSITSRQTAFFVRTILYANRLIRYERGGRDFRELDEKRHPLVVLLRRPSSYNRLFSSQWRTPNEPTTINYYVRFTYSKIDREE